MKKNDYNTENTPLENMTNEEIEKLADTQYFEGISYIEVTKWQRFKWWIVRNLKVGRKK